MSFEQPIYSFSEGGQPPTPTRTPTSASFAQTSFKTPTQESSFYDPRVTWNTADPYATSPDFLKTPKYLSFTTPTQSPPTEHGRKRPLSAQNIEEEIASHVHHPLPDIGLPLPPVDLSRQLSSSPNPSSSSSTTKLDCTGKSTQATPLKVALGQDTEPVMRSAGSMQTPPPTSTSALRRKVQKVQTVKLAKLSTANTRRMSSSVVERADTIDKAASKIEESPLQLPNLQFSPDEFSFPASGPATVPAYPQHKLFWDPDQGEEGMNIDFPTDDPFTFSGKPQKGLDPFVSSNAKSMVSQLPPSPSFDDFDTNTSQNVELSTIHGAADQSDFLPTSGLMISKGVNPSLLFSSPGCSSAPSVAVQLVQSDTLQPYANQIRDARIEKELSLDRKAKRRRKVQDDSPAVKAALQVLRDETDIHTEIEPPTLDVVVPHVHEARIRAGKATFTSAERNRREASTKKTQSIIHRHQSIQQSRKRTAVMLRIDKNGRAMTEARLVCDDEDSSHKSNPEVESLSDENESTSSSESDEMIISQPQSFAFPEPKTRKPKLARFATESKTHSQKSSYASTFASSNTTYTLPTSENPTGSRGTGTISSSKRRRGSHTKRRLHRTLSPTTMSDSIDGMRNDDRVVEVETETETTTSGDDNGGAQFELKKIVRNREQNNAMTRSGARNQTAGQRHVYTAFGDQIPANSYGKVMSTGQGRGLQMIDDISPTTVTDPELATPSSGRDSHASDSTRCICHASEVEGELMILCDSCKKWLHVSCVGLNRHKLPHIYLCVFCTGQTPNVRGGRIREPARASFAAPTSPLAHKSHRYR